MIVHLDSVVSTITDPFITSRYVGFVAVAAVAVYELAIKDIFIDFAAKKHTVFGAYAASHFDRINGRIKLQQLKDDYIARFGDKYLKRFVKLSKEAEDAFLKSKHISIKNSYQNIIECRNQFSHAGNPTTLTYSEAIAYYEAGKEIIVCLSNTMKR